MQGKSLENLAKTQKYRAYSFKELAQNLGEKNATPSPMY